MRGLTVRVRAVAGPPASPAAGGRAAQGQAPRSRQPQPSPAGPPSADPPAGPPDAPRPEGGTRGPGAAPEAGRAAQGPAAQGPAVGGQQTEPRRSPAPPPQDAGFADEEWPDDATGPGTGAENLTGMELIRRQLGGRVIQEIEDS
jgi:DNA polymerase III subunit gamma/tau